MKWPIAIHFIQFQSDAAPAPDPHMIDIACRSGGTYKFVNLQEIARSLQAHWQALAYAILRVRNGLAGLWKAGFFWSAIASKDLLANGTIHAISGDLHISSPRLSSLQEVYASVGGWRFGNTVGGEDRRLLLLKPCTGHE